MEQRSEKGLAVQRPGHPSKHVSPTDILLCPEQSSMKAHRVCEIKLNCRGLCDLKPQFAFPSQSGGCIILTFQEQASIQVVASSVLSITFHLQETKGSDPAVGKETTVVGGTLGTSVVEMGTG